ncbi:hypothetical protein Q3G72_008282 [Acer saccharum]|nr:hypothetical protein Q3G72_008282 [Acer saccharum]
MVGNNCFLLGSLMVWEFWGKRRAHTCFNIFIFLQMENYEILGLVVGGPWITEEEQVEPDHIEKVAKKRMQEHGMAGLVMSKDEEEAENHSNDEAVRVESFIQDFTNTRILKGVDYMYYHTKVFVSPLNVKRRIRQLKLERNHC